MSTPKKIWEIIKKYDRFLVTTHVNPDPDALCSQLAVADFLKSKGKSSVLVSNAAVPKRFEFFPGTSRVKAYSSQLKSKFDAVIVVDCGDLSRIGKVQSMIDPKRDPIINIDHHITNDKFGRYNWIKPHASSTCEMLYELFKAAKCQFTNNIALHLYAGIMTDTGSFRFDNTTSYTHAVVSELRKFSFSADKLYQNLYESIPYRDIEAFSKVMVDFKPVLNKKVIVIELTKAKLAKFSKEFDLRDTIFKFLRGIKGLEVIVILTQVEPKKVRVNFRSNNKVNVAKIAHSFQGGGHRKAAGCLVEVNMTRARKLVLDKLRKEL